MVCRQLGYNNGVVGNSLFEDQYVGRGPIWIDEITCSGNEPTLMDCADIEIGDHNCGHDEDVGVFCHGKSLRAANVC